MDIKLKVDNEGLRRRTPKLIEDLTDIHRLIEACNPSYIGFRQTISW